ncbi:hypothetical protein SEA_TARGET_38 [Mycobacterium phage Target]|nr:hypothetical protein SEA_TARGET_38 [Mycobacterium phage Target]
MSLKVGGLDVAGVFVGDAAAKVYVGAMKIWPPVPDFTPFTISSEDPGYEDLIDEQVPEGASGCWVTLVGGGGGGGAATARWRWPSGMRSARSRCWICSGTRSVWRKSG